MLRANGVINGVNKGAHKGRRLSKNHRRLQSMGAPQAEEDCLDDFSLTRPTGHRTITSRSLAEQSTEEGWG
jgi:hypothetical protein